MGSQDFHLRYLIDKAKEESKDVSILGNIRPLVDQAYAIIEANFTKFIMNKFSSELLVMFAEVACLVPPPMNTNQIERALNLYQRCKVAPCQFVARGYLVRCQIEARKMSDQLKGEHLVQQVKYALSFLLQAVDIAQMEEFKSRYAFIIFNASLIYWDVVRPLCRLGGWQKRVLDETQKLMDALNSAAYQGAAAAIKGGGGKDGKDAKGGGAPAATGYISTKSPIDPLWRAEFRLHLCFGLEDAGKLPEAQKYVDECFQAIQDAGSEAPGWLKTLVVSARAHMYRTNNASVRAQDKDTLILFIRNRGLTENVEKELVTYWSSYDPQFQEYYDGFGRVTVERPDANANLPEVQIKLGFALRAACFIKAWYLAGLMFKRIVQFRAPPPRARILMDLSKSELDVYRACYVIDTDGDTKLILDPDAQAERELQARVRAVRLCEQCLVAAKRTEDLDLVEESSILLHNFAIPLFQTLHRGKVHKSLAKAADTLREINSNCYSLRTMLHYESARCEIANDLLTKGQDEMKAAWAIDITENLDNLPENRKPFNRGEEGEGEEVDYAPFVRKIHDQQIAPNLYVLKWKLALYDDPGGLDQIMLWLQQRPISSNVIEKSYTTLVNEHYESLKAALADKESTEKPALRKKYVALPQWIVDQKPIVPRNVNHAPCSVWPLEGLENVSANDLDSRLKNDRENATEKLKTIALLFCQCAKFAFAKPEMPRKLVAEMCERAIEIEKFINIGPWPLELEFGIGIAEAAFIKARCYYSMLATVPGIESESSYEIRNDMESSGGSTGISLKLVGGEPSQGSGHGSTMKMNDTNNSLVSGNSGIKDGNGFDFSNPERVREENERKMEIINLIIYGIDIADKFKQPWLVFNGITHFWNLHLNIFNMSKHIDIRKEKMRSARPGEVVNTPPMLVYLMQVLPGVRHCMDMGDKWYLKNMSHLMRNITLLYLCVFPGLEPSKDHPSNEKYEGIEPLAINGDKTIENLLSKLGRLERKEVSSVYSNLILQENPATVPTITPIPARTGTETDIMLFPDQLLNAVQIELPEGKQLDLRVEGDVIKLVEQLYALREANKTDGTAALNESKFLPVANDAIGKLNSWQPRFEDESEAIIYLELWVRLGRACLECFFSDNNKTPAKYGLMCGIKALQNIDLDKVGESNFEPGFCPSNASPLRAAWRGSAFALCGSSLNNLIDPGKQERDSVRKLRFTAIRQFQAALEHCQCRIASHKELAAYCSMRMYNISISLSLADHTNRTFLFAPLQVALRVLSHLRYDNEPELLLGLYTSMFEILSADSQWLATQNVLNQAFQIVPTEHQRKLWALRMVALSKQGRDVSLAMARMKESQAQAQASIWIILAHSSHKRSDRYDAYAKAVEILSNAQQYVVLDVKLEFADWLTRNCGTDGSAFDIIKHGVNILLQVEDDAEAEEEMQFKDV